MSQKSSNPPKKLFEPIPAHVEFDELIATSDNPEDEYIYNAYLKSKCGHFYKCDVTWQHAGSSRFGIVRWNHSTAEEVLADSLSIPPENWDWHHEPIIGRTMKENQDFVGDIVDWCLNRKHKAYPPKLKPGWKIDQEELVSSIHNRIVDPFLKRMKINRPQVEHGLYGSDKPGESLSPDTDDSTSREDGGLSLMDGEPGPVEDVHFFVEVHRITTTKSFRRHPRGGS